MATATQLARALKAIDTALWEKWPQGSWTMEPTQTKSQQMTDKKNDALVAKTFLKPQF